MRARPRARLPDGRVRRQAVGRQRRVPAARRHARPHDRAAAAAPTRCRGASCRGSTPAAGIRRRTRASRCRRSPAIARWARAHGVDVQHRDQAHARTRARDRRRRRARRRGAVARRRRAAAAVVVLAEALDAARDAAPELPRAWLIENCRTTGAARRGARLHRARRQAHAADGGARRRHPRRRLSRGDWTANDPARVAELAGWGVDTIITDAVDVIAPDSLPKRS